VGSRVFPVSEVGLDLDQASYDARAVLEPAHHEGSDQISRDLEASALEEAARQWTVGFHGEATRSRWLRIPEAPGK
jgi:hypothetical protein